MSNFYLFEDVDLKNYFKEINQCVPKGSKLFLVGGTLRNLVYYSFFKKKLIQRDYDLILIGNHEKFIQNLRRLGFKYGKIRRKNQIVLKKFKIKNNKDFFENIVLDISFFENAEINSLLKNKINFTINGFAIEFKNIFKENWLDYLIKLPFAIEDIKTKKIRLNTQKTDFFGTDLYACIRFMSQGFKQPTKKEIDILFNSLKKLPKYKFERNKNKVFDYVGDDKKLRKILKELGLKEDIFSFDKINDLRKIK